MCPLFGPPCGCGYSVDFLLEARLAAYDDLEHDGQHEQALIDGPEDEVDSERKPGE
jgi:hypothetical protein